MTDTFPIFPRQPVRIPADASNKKLVAVNGTAAIEDYPAQTESGFNPDESNATPFERIVIERDSTVWGEGTVLVIPTDEEVG